MCVIMSKPANIAFPEESILKNCWDNNPDMGGFMYALNGCVHIRKGFETWESFINALNETRRKTGDNIAYVCHFRISTQGFDRACCQPFPLSSKMKNLKLLKCKTNIGVAHNGIIDLTSDGGKDYSDTMKFITDYLVNIIRGFDWHKDNRNIKLIENLIEGSRLAILDKTGFCKLLGKGWIEDNGVSYSNSSYSNKRYYKKYDTLWDYEYDDEIYWKSCQKGELKNKNPEWFDNGLSALEQKYGLDWSNYWNKYASCYQFPEDACPYSDEDDDSYCGYCSRCESCPYIMSIRKASGFAD